MSDHTTITPPDVASHHSLMMDENGIRTAHSSLKALKFVYGTEMRRVNLLHLKVQHLNVKVLYQLVQRTFASVVQFDQLSERGESIVIEYALTNKDSLVTVSNVMLLLFVVCYLI